MVSDIVERLHGAQMTFENETGTEATVVYLGSAVIQELNDYANEHVWKTPKGSHQAMYAWGMRVIETDQEHQLEVGIEHTELEAKA